jgi:DNA-binding response OmpR family regulator
VGNVKKTVIIIDDDKSILRTFSKILLKDRYEVEIAETGKEALEKLSKRDYDIALIDIRLPDMDGGDILVIARNELTKTVKIIITGLTSTNLGNVMLEQGADAFLVKPVNPDQLLGLIEEKLREKKTRPV